MTQEGVLRGRTVQRLAPDRRWADFQLDSLRGTPWDMTPAEREELQGRVAVDMPAMPAVPAMPAPAEPQHGRLHIMKADVQRHGAQQRVLDATQC